jgi:hypothetical protein
VPSNILDGRLQQTAAFQAVQQGVQGSGADAIPLMGQLLHLRKPEDGLVGRRYEYMCPYETGIVPGGDWTQIKYTSS